jgi:hypothetical protein
MLWSLANIAFFLVCLLTANSLQIDLFPGKEQCIGQELDQLENAVFAISAVAKVKDPKQKVALTVTDPEEEYLLQEIISIGAKLKESNHQIESRGLYELCFALHGGKTPVRIFFHVEYRADSSRKVKEDELPTLERQLLEVQTKIDEISKEIEHTRKQEMSLKEAGETISSRIQWFSALSIIVLLSTSIWQIIYLRNFFSSKKLL